MSLSNTFIESIRNKSLNVHLQLHYFWSYPGLGWSPQLINISQDQNVITQSIELKFGFGVDESHPLTLYSEQ